MAFTRTTDLIAKLSERLSSLPLREGDTTNKLFQRVGAFGANRLAQAMKSVFASEQRVCFIVPGGDKHANTLDSVAVRSERTTALALLIADRCVVADSAEALVGGKENLGILDMKDEVIRNLFEVPFAIDDRAYIPGDGEPLIISDTDKPAGNLGRECYLLWLHAYAGESRAYIPQL